MDIVERILQQQLESEMDGKVPRDYAISDIQSSRSSVCQLGQNLAAFMEMRQGPYWIRVG